MDYKVSFSQRSRSDLKAITRFIAFEGLDPDPVAAEKMAEDLIARVEQLKAFPQSGKQFIASERGEIRELACRGYRIFFRLEKSRAVIRILHIRHGARKDPNI